MSASSEPVGSGSAGDAPGATGSDGHLRRVPFDEAYRRSSAVWLQDQELHDLVDAPPFDEAAQQEWFSQLDVRRDYRIWGVELDGVPIGAMGLKRIDGDEAEYFMYIGVKELWGRGIGAWASEEILDVCRAAGIDRPYGWIRKDNERSIRAHLKYGWVIAGEDETRWRVERPGDG